MAEFAGFQPDDFDTLAGSSWRNRDALGGLLAETLGNDLTGRTRIFHTGGIYGFNAFLARYTPSEADPRDIVVAVLCSGFSLDTRFADRPANQAEARIASVVLSGGRKP